VENRNKVVTRKCSLCHCHGTLLKQTAYRVVDRG